MSPRIGWPRNALGRGTAASYSFSWLMCERATISIKVLTKLLDYLPQVLCVFLDGAASFL
jgi:hypothetical protein